MRNIIQNYSEISSIQGVVYIFQSHQTLVGRLFWIAVIAFMLTLGMFLVSVSQPFFRWRHSFQELKNWRPI